MASKISLESIILLRSAADSTSEHVADWGEEVKNAFSGNGVSCVDLLGLDINLIKLSSAIRESKGVPVIAFYGHGSNPDGFWHDTNNVEFMNCETVSLLKNCFVYAACCNSLTMGERVREKNGIVGVIGYMGPFDVVLCTKRYEMLFKECLNSGLLGLSQKRELSLVEIFNHMKAIFEQCLMKLVNGSPDEHSLVAAMSINKNSKMLGFLGDSHMILEV